jgi:hypothetical protein
MTEADRRGGVWIVFFPKTTTKYSQDEGNSDESLRSRREYAPVGLGFCYDVNDR